MRSYSFPFLLLLLLTFSWTGAWASPASRFALGDPYLVLEEDSTKASLLNFGNPAGLVDLPTGNRIDLSANADYAANIEKFETSGNTTNPYAHVTPNGQTLPANAYFNQHGYYTQSLFNQYNRYYLDGFIFHPSEQWALQLRPLAGYTRSALDEDQPPSRLLNSGLGVNGALKIGSQWSLGAGVTYQTGQSDGWPDQQFSDILKTAFINHLDDLQTLSAKIGLIHRISAVFDDQDRLSMGVLVDGQQQAAGGDYYVLQSLTPTAHIQYQTLPWSIGWQSLYQYKSVMDIGLQIGYEENKDYYQWTSSLLGDQNTFGYSTRQNVFYDLTFRVRLPMVREDDLRFGVDFSNRDMGARYPSGKIIFDRPELSAKASPINTSASSITIDGAVVPYTGSLVFLSYYLGSSNSYQSGQIIDDYGFTNFTLGVQFKLWEWLMLRSAYINERQTTEVHLGGTTIFNRETGSFRFGVGYTSEDMEIDLAASVFRTQYMPVTNTILSDTFIRGMKGMLSLVYKY